MSEQPIPPGQFTRRKLLKTLQYAPLLWVPASLRLRAGVTGLHPLSLADIQVSPHYPTPSPLDGMLRLITPGSDRYTSEKYACEIDELLGQWKHSLTARGSTEAVERLLHTSLSAATPITTPQGVDKRYGITVSRQKCSQELTLGRERFIGELKKYLSGFKRISVAEFQLISIRELRPSAAQVEGEIRYTIIGEKTAGAHEQRVGYWQTRWIRGSDTKWQAEQWLTLGETVCQANGPIFADVTAQAMGQVGSYQEQMLRGTDYWRTVLDGACGIDVYGNQGVAVGDYDNDGFDDIYVCQPAGLPNRLYRNRGDGTFADVTEESGLAVLDPTSCALFADFENRGIQDLLVVTSSGPLLFVNDGQGKFSRKPDAFKFANAPQGSFTHAAVADYDHDGRLDLYFCLYNYYAGLDQYRYPSPYFDARNGPPNFLLRNLGAWNFEDATAAAGLNVDNNRYSFACAWGDSNDDGWPDLCVANDFGRNNLYRNNGDGTFSSVAGEAGVEDVGAGMSACWLDADGDGKQDIYVANMWSAAGLRVSQQANFHPGDAQEIRAMYQRHARGNSLYRNLGSGKFKNSAAEANVEFGGWAWSSDSWDFDHDGYSDIYIANGYVSGSAAPELSSFFWRQVVGNSPDHLSPASDYEHAWDAINELIRSDHSWNGYERNVLYSNNHDGSFSDISGLSGLDFPDDSRAFALADLDHNGRLEVVLKNRTAPQIRVLRNSLDDIGNSIVFRLRGSRSNRDAIGAAVTVEADGRRQTRYLQAGSGFLSQHTKELVFGLGARGAVDVAVRWPNGAVQKFQNVPANHRIEIIEDAAQFHAQPFSQTAPAYFQAARAQTPEPPPNSLATWLIQPLLAPDFSLPDPSGKMWDLHSIAGKKLVVFWSQASSASLEQLQSLASHQNALGAQVLAIHVNQPGAKSLAPTFATPGKLPFPALLASDQVIGIYNIVLRYLFDRHRDLGVPTALLVDGDNAIVKVYRGSLDPSEIANDAHTLPRSATERVNRSLPFPGTLHLGAFQRNDFTYGVALFQRGYLDAAADSFKRVIAAKPAEAEAYYNLGTLYLRTKNFDQARSYLETAVKLKPDHAQAWNNLGMIAAEQANIPQAVEDFQKSVALRPDYSTALLNLGNIYRRQKLFADAEKVLVRAFEGDPANPEASYSLGMLYAQQNQIEQARAKFQAALTLRPDYPDALNNFGVLLVREQRYPDAEQKFEQCIRSNPDFDQAYMNLARLYLLEGDRGRARDVLEALLRRHPGHPMAQQALKMLE